MCALSLRADIDGRDGLEGYRNRSRYYQGIAHEVPIRAVAATVMSVQGPGCVKTFLREGCAELFSQLPSSGRSCRYNRLPHRRNRDRSSTRKFGIGVFTQPGSSTDLTAPKLDFCSSPESGLKSDVAPCPFRATTGLMHCNKSVSIRSPRRPVIASSLVPRCRALLRFSD
jgi:hypothetical protein